MGALGPRGKSLVVASLICLTPPSRGLTPPSTGLPPSPLRGLPPSLSSPATDLLPLSCPGAVLPSMVEMGVRWSWSGERREETSIGLWTTVHGIEFTLEPKCVSCNLKVILSVFCKNIILMQKKFQKKREALLARITWKMADCQFDLKDGALCPWGKRTYPCCWGWICRWVKRTCQCWERTGRTSETTPTLGEPDGW